MPHAAPRTVARDILQGRLTFRQLPDNPDIVIIQDIVTMLRQGVMADRECDIGIR